MLNDFLAFPRFIWKHKRDFAPFVIIVIFKLLLHGDNFTEFPYYENDEATYSIRALSFAEDGSFDNYTYWYDHAPAGWMFMSLWYIITGKALLFGSLINSSRLFILILTTISAILVYMISKKIIKDRWFSMLAALLFIASPLSLYFQRRVLLDNIMVFWTLLALLFVLNKPLRMRDSFISGLAFSLAVLTKLNAIFFAPAFFYALYKHAPEKIRTMSLALWAGVSGSVMLLFPLYALLKGELFSKNPNPETGAFDNGISLIDSLTYQSSRGTGDGTSFWEPGSSFYQALVEWTSKDVTLMGFVFVASLLVGLLFSGRLRDKFSQLITINLVLLGMVLFLVRGGVVLEFYFIPLIPFATILVAAILSVPLHIKSVQSSLVKNIYRVGIAVVLIGVQFPAILSHQAFRNNETSNMVQAVDWVRDNLPSDAVIASDNYATLFLNVNGDYDKLHYNFKFEYDPDIREIIANDWRNIDYILVTHEVIKQIRVGQTPFIKEAFDHSYEIASFTDQTSSFNDLKNYISTNGDWVKIFKVKNDNEVIRQQSWQGALDNHLVDYGQIVDSKDNLFTSSQYQSNALVRALHEDDKAWFDGIWAWSRDHLQNRFQDKLLSSVWSNGEDGVPTVTNPNSDALADLEFAYALYNAADKWEEPSYKDVADEILADYWEYEIVSSGGQFYVLPQKTEQLTAPFAVNPGHLAIPYFEYFKNQGTPYDWEKLITDSYDLLSRVQDSNTGLFPNWVNVSATGIISSGFSYAGASADRYGYEAFRIPYWLGQQTDTDTRAKELLIPYGLYVANLYEQDEQIPAVIELDGSNPSLFDDTLMYGSAYYGVRLVNPDLADTIMRNEIANGGFNPDTGLWARDGSNVFNQFWLPILINDVSDLSIAAPLPVE